MTIQTPKGFERATGVVEGRRTCPKGHVYPDRTADADQPCPECSSADAAKAGAAPDGPPLRLVQ